MPSSFLWLLLVSALALSHSNRAAQISSADLPLEARGGTSLEDDDLISTSYVLPNQIFNDGKPYYASKDPISGQLDFSAKKPAGIETAVNEVVDPKEKIVLNSNSPNIHDFLNLPVKYSSSKFVYPMVSSSYANLKYQGSNKNYITNKKPTSVVATPVTPSPSHNYYTVPTTKLMAVPPTAPGFYDNPASSSSTSSSSTSTTSTTTSKKPTTVATKPTTTSSSTTTTTTTTTHLPSSSKYTTSTRKPTHSLTTVATHTTPSTTRKKFVPTKKYSPTTPSAVTGSTPLRFPDERPLSTAVTARPPTSTTITRYTTSHPPTTLTSTQFVSSTKQPIVFTESPTPQTSIASRPPSALSTRIPDLNVADVYQTLGQKNTEQHIEQKPPMSLADIFNSLAEEESAVASQSQGNQGFDAQGNFMQPITLSMPSPFATQPQQQHPQPTHSSQGSTTAIPGGAHDQKLISNSQENYSGEYVSYQVQQPNVMQYRPAPGAINNVVISPGQNSASFVLGSQQQVGAAAFGSVEKQPLFAKEPPVQYGTVINEDISSLKRPGQVATQDPNGNFPPPQAASNFHQNGNFAAMGTASSTPYGQRPQGGTSAPTATGNYAEEPPAPPSPYQQLPLIGSNMRPRKPTKPQQQPQALASTYPQPTQPVSSPHTQLQTPQQESTNVVVGAQDTKELLVTSNIRFPSNEEQLEEGGSVPVGAGPPASPQVNGHAQPLSLQQLQQSNPVVFPKGNEEIAQNTVGTDAAGEVQIQQQEVLTMNQHKQKLSFPSQQDQNAPSQHMEPPPRFPPALVNAVPEHTEIHKRPQPNRPPGPPAYAYNDYTRKPIPGITRPIPDRHLPNILPQFRPNAKISAGHPAGAGYGPEPGNVRIAGPPLKRPNASPQFAHRRQPLMQQHRYPLNRADDYPPGAPSSSNANRRVYRLPPYGGQGLQYLERMYPRRPLPAPQRVGDNYERHAAASNTEIYKTIMAPERLAAFEEEDLVINDPPQPVTPSKEQQLVDMTKLEPVVTLQMLQSQKKAVSLPSDDNGSGEIQVPAMQDDSDAQLKPSSAQNGLYVVYPMKGENQNLQTIGDTSKEALPAIAHVEPPSGSDYQNTPFSVVRDQPQEPILKNKKPQSLQQQNKLQPTKDKFPYPIEKPDPVYSELNAPLSQGVLIAPRIISGAYGAGSPDTPIAIAYSPTEPNPYRRVGDAGNTQHYSNINLATSVISEIRPDTQTEEGISNDFDLRGQNLEKNFMAPFYPSISLDGTATSAPANGWNVLPSTTEQSLYEKNNINRADVGELSQTDDVDITTSKNFEMDRFQPELQGGFKPIYPPGYKIDDGENNEQAIDETQENKSASIAEHDTPMALASYMRPAHVEEDMVASSSSTSSSSTSTSTTPKPQTIAISTSSSSSSSTTTTTTPKPIIATSVAPKTSTTATTPAVATRTSTTVPTPPPKKSTFETSLAALLFGDDEEFEDGAEARKQHEDQTKVKSTTRPAAGASAGAPRMGPRSLKLS